VNQLTVLYDVLML